MAAELRIRIRRLPIFVGTFEYFARRATSFHGEHLLFNL